MADAFWDPIYKKALEDLDLFRWIVEDSPDGVLLELVRPHPVLSRQVSPFTKKGKITNRASFNPIFLKVASQDALLRRILLFGWIEANRSSLAFVSIPPDEAGKQRLLKGEFGSVSKLRVLSRLDPREGAKLIYAEVCAVLEPAPEEILAGQPSPESPVTAENTTLDAVLPAANRPSETDVRRDLGELRSEARDLRKKVKELEYQRGEAERRGTTLNQHLRDTELALDEVRRALAQTTARVQELERRALPVASSPHPAPTPSGTGEGIAEPSSILEVSRADLTKRVKQLEEVLARREAAIERLEKDLTSVRSAEAKGRESQDQVRRLRERVSELEQRLEQAEQARPVRLLLREAEPTPAGFRPLIETLHGERLLLPPSVHPPKGAVEGEWCLQFPASEELPERLLPLEAARRAEIIGSLRLLENGARLESTLDWFPVVASIQGFDEGAPVAGVWLPAAPDRPEGIHALRILPGAPVVEDDSRLSFVALQKRLGLGRFDREAFISWARAHDTAWAFDETGLYNLPSAEAVLSEIRRTLPVETLCDREGCRTQALSRPFVRDARAGELCGGCQEEVGEPMDELSRIEIRPCRILIAGGDAVGSNYRDAFACHGIDATWISGFAGLGGLREGLKEFKLAVVILKQISHTLLRELSQAARQSGVRLVYSPCRGVSGVVRMLAEKLR